MQRTLQSSLLALLALAGCNEAPTTLIVEIVPVESADVERRVTSADDLQANFIAGARDIDFDEITYTYAWSVDGAARAEFTGATVTADATTKGQVWSVTVTPSDGKADGVPATAEATIANTPPQATVSATETVVRSTETLEIAGSGSDFDGDTVEILYYWLNTGKGTPFDGPTVPSAATYPGEIWTGHAVPFDGEIRGKAATVQIVIRNGIPSVDELTLTPDTVFVTDDIVANVIATDPDRQPITLTYVWTVDGTEVQRGNGRNVLPTGKFSKHQVVAVSVTPDDGVDDGEAVSAMLTVNNTLPTRPEAAIFPEEPIPGIDDMRCGLTVPSFDADGDDINYRIEWMVNGLKYTGAVTSDLPGDTIDRGAFFDDEEWSCTIVPYDDDIDGPAVVVEVIPETWSGVRAFSPCGATGNKGPTQVKCDTGDGYLNTDLEDEVIVTDGLQEWTVPVDGTYRITARGSEGSASTVYYSYSPGQGAVLRGDFDLKRGDVLTIAVGQQGKTDPYSAGGGGATWVMASDDSPYLVAGGGGSVGYYGAYYGRRNGCDALTSSYGGYGGGSSYSSVAYNACRAKTSRLGLGGTVPGSYSGNAGAGIDGDGASDPYSYYGGSGGFSWSEGVGGGKGSANGGFGGGGGGNGSYAAGGGGGYSGGDASRNVSGGGGSYNTGRNQSNTVSNADFGAVTIDLISL